MRTSGADRGLGHPGGVLLKMGGYGFLRFSLPMFPKPRRSFAPLVFGLSMVAVVYTSLSRWCSTT
jgi:NADH:ubiquinone oxidoreductase subunit 4 (subunit M)